MFHHIVMYKVSEPREEICKEIKRRFLEMPAIISEIKEIKVGIDEVLSERSYDISLYVKFDSKEDYEAYKVNPFHLSVASYIKEVKISSHSVDFND